MAEYWRDIEGFEGLYKVSTLGRVKSLKDANDNYREKIKKQVKDKDGYLRVSLYKNGKMKNCLVHRLVIENFMGKPLDNDYYSVNHIDENKTNNKLENLQYCTVRFNNTYGSRVEKASKSNSKPVIGINKINGYICEFNSITEAGRVTGINYKNISACCLGKQKFAGKYHWYFKEVEIDEK